MSKPVRASLIAAFVVGALLAVWAFGPFGLESRESTSVVPPAVAISAPVPGRPASDEPFTYADAITRLERGLEFRRERAAARDDDWLAVEQLAAVYMERAKLTGDWEDYRRAERELARAFEIAPDRAGPHLSQATLDYGLHRFDRARESLAAIEGYAVVTQDDRRAVASMRADLMLQTGQYEEAEAAYTALLEEERSRDAIVGMAGVLWHTGRRAEADTLLAEAEDLATGADILTRAWVCLARGLLALDDARLDDALAHYRRGMEHFPGWWLLEEHEAEVLAEKGETDRALAIYRDVIERTGNPELMDAAAAILEERGEHEEARELRARAHEGHEARIAMYPEAAYGHALGHFLEHEGDEARAVEIAERNRDARPNGEAWTQLAQAYARAGRLEEAREAIAHVRATPYRSLELDETAEAILASR